MLQYEKLEQRLKARGMNRTQLAKELGISSRTIAKTGKGERLSPRILQKIAAYLGCRPQDLYAELPDGATPVTGEDLSGAGVFHSGNAMYFIDKNHRIAAFNRALAKIYPALCVGDVCYSAIMQREQPCPCCPLTMDNDEDMPFYNSHLRQWISVRRAEMTLPGIGSCGGLICRADRDVQRGIRGRLPLMTGYDVYIEMNLTQNCYRIILPDDPAQEKDFSPDRLDSLIRRTADTLVHPDDRDAFLEFWDLATLPDRISGPEHKIHGEFRECRRSGVWDTIYITIVQEEYYGSDDVMAMALYMILPGHAAVRSTDADNCAYAGERKINLDYMTGLPLRRSFWELVDSAMPHRAGGTEYCVLYSDIERFHVINNWYGRAAGDALLAEIGGFLKSCDSAGEILSGYMGGDNFCTVFRRDETTLARITGGVTDIVTRFRSDAGFRPLFGACRTDFTRLSPADAYDRCVMAVSRSAKPGADGVSWYDERMIAEQQAEEQLLFRFRRGMENGEITFYLQPKCDIRTGRIVGAEALARWEDGENGFISPSLFVPVLEKAGKIAELDYFVWESVCRTIARWRAAGLPVLPVSVNVSRVDVFSMDIVHNFTALIDRFGLRPSDIELEITESAYMENDTILREVQSGLRAAGFCSLIDDFGSGFSSLNFLKDIDCDAIKLDLRFLESTGADPEKSASIVASVLEMADKINVASVAEGVETKEQADFLLYNGCPLAQGFYFYKPMPAAEYEALLADPARITEGLHLADFRPRPRQETGSGIRSFSGFDEHLAAFMKTLQDMAALVRVVDVDSYTEYRLDRDGRLTALQGHCYDIWGRKESCSTCIAAKAVQSGQAKAKYETLGKETYYIIAKPIRIGGQLYAIETAIQIAQE